ncbi:MAG: 50S ribosomal protein L25 [Gemmataceae bacterium]|nr:50S ribosomal protein L25 [Gemmataceae bacterium]
MADSVTLNAQERQGAGTRWARRLRKQGQVPCALYGHKEATLSLTIPSVEIAKAIRHGVRLLDLKHEKGTEKALIREVQWDHLGSDILHVDFARISVDERIEVEVRVEIRGTAPGVAEGGNLISPLHTLHVECLAISIPESIRVNISELHLNQSIHVKELKLPEGVKVLNDADAIVVQVVPAKEEAEAAPVEGDTGEPEVLGKKKEDAEEEK